MIGLVPFTDGLAAPSQPPGGPGVVSFWIVPFWFGRLSVIYNVLGCRIINLIEWIVLYAVTHFLFENFLQFAKSFVSPLSNPNYGLSLIHILNPLSL